MVFGNYVVFIVTNIFVSIMKFPDTDLRITVILYIERK